MSKFAFRAAAVALGGFFTRPVHEPLPIQAASFLPTVGGYGTARVGPFRFRELVSFDAAYTQVIGTEYLDGKPARTTLAAAVIEGLNVFDMVTADRVVGRLASESAFDGQPSGELGWLPLGSYFVNLRIAGVPIDLPIHATLLRESAATFSAIKASGAEKLFNPDDGASLQGDRIRCSMFEPLPATKKVPVASVTKGWRIRIPGFGDVYLGEYVITSDHRQLSMVRVEQHSPAEGNMEFCSLEGNGSPY